MAAKAGPHLVGLDVGSTGVRAVEVKWSKGDKAYRITKAASVDLPRDVVRNGAVVNPKLLAKALKKLWRTGHFSTKKVAFGLADSGVLTRQIDVPWMPEADFRTALRYQVSDVLPVDLDTVQLDYHVLSEEHRVDEHDQPLEMNRILLAATSSEGVLQIADALRQAKLEPVTADSSAFALIRTACQGRIPQAGQAHAIVDLGADQLTVVIHQSGQPRFIRTIGNLGGDNATDDVAERLRMEPEDAEALKRQTGLNGPAPVVAPIAESSVFRDISTPAGPVSDPRVAATVEALNPWATTVVGEIRNSLDYFQASDPGSPIQSLTITGRAVQLAGFVERVATQIPLPVHVMDPFGGLSTSRKLERNRPPDTRMVVATGLAMRGRP